MNKPINQNDLLAMIAALKAENDSLKAAKAKARPFGMKIGEKKALSVYGMGRFPVTLYAQQWQALLAKQAEILAYIEAHKAELSWKE